MIDLIDRAMAIEIVEKMMDVYFDRKVILARVIDQLKDMPSAQPKRNEWCTDCKEYDKETHCCHRFSSVIREALDELQLVRCRDCKFYVKHDKRCKVWNHGVAEYEYCYRGVERWSRYER